MKYVKEFGILALICWIGVAVEAILPFPLPASIIAMVLLLCFLLLKVLKPSQIQGVSGFMLDAMAFFFIPAGVGLINYFDILKANLLPLAFIVLVSTVVTFAVTAYSVKLTRHFMKKGSDM